MTEEMVDTVVIYELTDSGLTPEFFTNTTLLAFDATLDDFIEDIIDANPTKFCITLHFVRTVTAHLVLLPSTVLGILSFKTPHL